MRTGKERFADRPGDVLVSLGVRKTESMGQFIELWSTL